MGEKCKCMERGSLPLINDLVTHPVLRGRKCESEFLAWPRPNELVKGRIKAKGRCLVSLSDEFLIFQVQIAEWRMEAKKFRRQME